MKLLIWTLLLFTNIVIAQSNEKFLTDFMFESELKAENLLDNYNGFDFFEIWTQTENHNVLGIIGKEHQRIKIKLISIKKTNLIRTNILYLENLVLKEQSVILTEK